MDILTIQIEDLLRDCLVMSLVMRWSNVPSPASSVYQGFCLLWVTFVNMSRQALNSGIIA